MGMQVVMIAGLALLGGLALGFALVVRKIRSLKSEVDQAKAEFQSQVGYACPWSLTEEQPPPRGKSTPLGKLTHITEIYDEAGSRFAAQTWTLDCGRPPRAQFQLFDKALLRTLQEYQDLAAPFPRVLTIRHPGPHPIGDAELDARFTLYADDPAGASALLRNPALRSSLLGFSSLALSVDAQGACFGDPADSNVYAWGASRADLNPAPAIRSALRVHLAVEKLLGLVAVQ